MRRGSSVVAVLAAALFAACSTGGAAGGGAGGHAGGAGRELRLTQNGRVRWYATGMAAGFVVMFGIALFVR